MSRGYKTTSLPLSDAELLEVAQQSIKEWDGSGPPFDFMKVEFLLSAFHKLGERLRTTTEGEGSEKKLLEDLRKFIDKHSGDESEYDLIVQSADEEELIRRRKELSRLKTAAFNFLSSIHEKSEASSLSPESSSRLRELGIVIEELYRGEDALSRVEEPESETWLERIIRKETESDLPKKIFDPDSILWDIHIALTRHGFYPNKYNAYVEAIDALAASPRLSREGQKRLVDSVVSLIWNTFTLHLSPMQRPYSRSVLEYGIRRELEQVIRETEGEGSESRLRTLARGLVEVSKQYRENLLPATIIYLIKDIEEALEEGEEKSG